MTLSGAALSVFCVACAQHVVLGVKYCIGILIPDVPSPVRERIARQVCGVGAPRAVMAGVRNWCVVQEHLVEKLLEHELTSAGARAAEEKQAQFQPNPMLGSP